MPKSLQLNIPTPCHEDWQNMTPNEKGRHCMACQKTVVDFTLMNDRQILDYISKSNSNICGRVANDQLQRPIQMAASNINSAPASIWKFLVPAVLLTGRENSQPKNIKPGTYQVSLDEHYSKGKVFFEKPIVDTSIVVDTSIQVTMGVMAFPLETERLNLITGHIFDANTNEPIDGVSIKILGTKRSTISRKGGFTFEDIKNKKDLELELSAAGYQRKRWLLSKKTDWTELKIPMTPGQQKIATVTVDSTQDKIGSIADKLDMALKNHQVPTELLEEKALTGFAGGLIYCYKIPKAQKIIRSIVDTLTIPAFKSVKVYPNPIMRGNNINLELSIKQTGDYKLEIMDMSGRVVSVQPLLVNENKQINQVPTSIAWSKGIYWLRITGQHTKSVYQAKILLQ